MVKLKLFKEGILQQNNTHKFFLNLYFSILLLGILINSQSIVLPAQTVQSQYIRAGTYSWQNPNTSNTAPFTINNTITYSLPLTNGSPLRNVALSFETLNYVVSSSATFMDFQIISQNITNTGFVGTLICKQTGQNFIKTIIRYMTIDTTIPYSKIHIDLISQIEPTGLNGPLNTTITKAYDSFTPLQNLTFIAGNTYKIQYYNNYYFANATNTRQFILNITSTILNSTHYSITLINTNNKLWIKQWGFYTVIINQNASFFEYDALLIYEGFLNMTNKNNDIFNLDLIFKQIIYNNLLIGLSSFDASGFPNLDFLTTIRQNGLKDIKVLQGRKYNFVYYTFLTFQKVNCSNSSAPILRISPDPANSTLNIYQCISDCGPRMGGPRNLYTTSMKICDPCTTISCYTCATNLVDCLTCSSSDNRVLNGTVCQPMTGYYQNGTVIAPKCPNLCTSCLNSTYCQTCISGANLYSPATNQYLCQCSSTTYYDTSNNSCVLCNITLSYCIQCNTKTVCVLCANDTYFLQSNTCKVCSSFITGCSRCNSSTFCLQCLPGFVYNNIAGTCSCPVGQFLNTTSKTCVNCKTGCSACSSLTICTNCTLGYYLSGNNCLVCPDSNCTSCSNVNTCLTCVSPMVVSTSNTSSCTFVCTVTNCILCPNSPSTCIQCASGYRVSATNSSLCEVIPCTVTNCIECPTSISICTQCINMYQVSSTNSSICQLIPCNVTYCFLCPTDINICTQCETGYQVSSTNSSLCQIIPSSCLVSNCLNCSIGASNVCQTCLMGYQITSTNQCQTRCGDGICILSTQQCDDGNLDNMDGCSPQCLIQAGFVCQLPPAPAIPLSDCSYTEQINFSITRLEKIEGQNQVLATASISPLLKAFQTYNFSSLVSTDLPVSSMVFDYNPETGVLKMTMNYTQTIQDVQAIVTINPPNLGIFRLTPSSSVKVTMNTANNAGLYIYDDKQYQIGNTVATFSTLLAALAWILFIFGLFAGKMIVVQMFAVFQISYFALMALSKMSPSVLALRNLFLSNGFNPFFVVDFYQYDYFPSSFKGIHLTPQFFNNLNISFLFIMIPLIVALISFILTKTKYKEDEQKKQLCQKLYTAFIGEYTFLMIIISLYLISVASLIEFFYGFTSLSTIVDYISIPECIILLALAVTYFVLLILKPEMFGQFKNSFDSNNRLSYGVYNYMMIQRLFISIILVSIYFSALSLIIPLALFVLEIVYLILKKPYEPFKHNYRMVANNVIAIVILIIYIYIGMDSVGSATTDFAIYLPFIILSLLAVCLVLNGYFIVVGFIIWIRQKCLSQSNEIEEQKQNTKKIEEFQMSYFKAQTTVATPKQSNEFHSTLVSQIRNPDESMVVAPQVENIQNRNSDDFLNQENRMQVTVPTFINIDQFFSQRPEQAQGNVLQNKNLEQNILDKTNQEPQNKQDQQQIQQSKEEQDEINNVENILDNLKKIKKQNASIKSLKSNKSMIEKQDLSDSIGQMLNQKSNRVCLLDEENYQQI